MFFEWKYRPCQPGKRSMTGRLFVSRKGMGSTSPKYSYTRSLRIKAEGREIMSGSDWDQTGCNESLTAGGLALGCLMANVDRVCRRIGLISGRTVYVRSRRRFVHWETIRTPGFAWEFTRPKPEPHLFLSCGRSWRLHPTTSYHMPRRIISLTVARFFNNCGTNFH